MSKIFDYSGENTTKAIIKNIKTTFASKDHKHSWNDLNDRPFYDITTEVELLGATEVEIPDPDALWSQIPCSITLTEGNHYTITFNGTAYECEAWLEWDATVVGNADLYYGYGFTEGMPFCFSVGINGDCYLTTTTPGIHTISIRETLKEAVPLERKYIAEHIDDLAKKEHTHSYNDLGDRPFYTIYEEGDVVIDETEIVFRPPIPIASADAYKLFEEGKTYKVVFDGVAYTCTAWADPDGTDTVCIGNGDLNGYYHVEATPFLVRIAEYTYDYGTEFSASILADPYDPHIISVIELIDKHVIKIDPKYLPEIQEQIQPDWNQNDENQSDFVKNRPFYTAEPILTTILEETSVTITRDNGYTKLSTGIYLELDQTYTVTFNGTSYDCVAYEMWGANVIGNSAIVGGSTGNNEPFIIVGGGNDLVYATTAGTHAISITAMISEVIKLDAKYLPDEATEQAGLKVEGQSFVIGETTVTASIGAEIFNNYYNNKATGEYSHAEGYNTTASGVHSHAEGGGTVASDANAHAEGYNTTAAGKYSHSEGHSSEANGDMSHAEGHYSVATGSYSHAEGLDTIATADASHAQGRYNVEDAEGIYAHIVGNGTSAERSNAHTLDWNGNAWFAGNIYVGGTSQSDTNVKQLVTKDYVDSTIGDIESALDTILGV